MKSEEECKKETPVLSSLPKNTVYGRPLLKFTLAPVKKRGLCDREVPKHTQPTAEKAKEDNFAELKKVKELSSVFFLTIQQDGNS